ncbi:MAG TPA: DUF2254 domain-containing protein [Gemmatimonadaceae bacterium]|nr:DUF2254 domain-containing protein [Gemmatimonadaceae bacterium]
MTAFRVHLLRFWERVATGLWVVPSLVVAGAAVLAALAMRADRWLAAHPDGPVALPRALEISADGARAVLTVVAGSMLGVMGTVVAMIVISFTLAATQFSPRVLHAFTRDRGTQLVIGAFTGTFTYALLVLHAVRGAQEREPFAPGLSVAVGILLALCGVAAIIYFSHHVAVSIQAPNVIANLARATLRLCERPFPEGVGAALDPEPAEHALAHYGLAGSHAFAPVAPLPGSGYVQRIDAGRLLELARRRDVVIRMERAPGDFVPDGDPLVSVAPAALVNDALRADINGCFALGDVRAMHQDVDFGVRQLVDMLVKAHASSDPSTAVTCLDHLVPLLRRLGATTAPCPYRADGAGRLRLITRGPTFDDIAGRALTQIRFGISGDVQLTAALLESLARIACTLTRDASPGSKELLRQQGTLAARAAREEAAVDEDRALIDRLLRALTDELGATG